MGELARAEIHDDVDGVVDARVVVACLKGGNHFFFNDAFPCGIGDVFFEAVAGSYGHLALLSAFIGLDEDDHAVVLALLSYAPAVPDLGGIFLDAIALQVVDEQDQNLGGSAVVICHEFVLQRIDLGGTQTAGEVVHEARRVGRTRQLGFQRSAHGEQNEVGLEDEFAAMGYTRDDYEADLEYATSDEEHDLQPTVNVSLYLKLDGESLVAEVPYDEMKYYSEFPITGLRILPFMCSSGLSDEGFLFVPDGSGATINFNNGKTSSSVFSAPVYGWDYGQMRKEVVKDSAIRFPVYGISFKNRNASLLCMIEEGDSYATIEADIAGKSHAFNFVNSQFLVVHNDLANISGRSVQDIYIYESKLPAGEKLKLRFTPVNSSDYVDMAKTYHDYLAEKYPELAQKVTKTGLPTAVEMIGSIIKVQHILGFPKELPYALTTYNEMGDILGDLHDSGWDGVNVVLTGWFNRGVVHDWPDDIDLIRKLGRKKDFKNLLSKLEGYGYSVSGKANFQFVHNNKLLDGFVAKSDAARYLSREVAEFYPISDVWYGEIKEKDAYYYAKPSYSMKALTSYLKDADKLGIKNIAFETIGNTLGSDYHPRTGTSRQANKNLQEQKLAGLKDRENVIYNGNVYAVPYADLVIDFPIHAGGTSIEDDSIPFFPIALHGYVRYTGDSVNITNDYIMNLLHSAETGAGLYFIFMEADSDELQESEFTYYFGAKYDSWKDSAKEVYNRYKADFGGLVSETIEDHTKIDDGVFVTEYSDGTLVYVNYRTLPYTTNGVTIPAQDWVIGKKGGK